ncbi:MAG: PorP/SprF family type IX secretion system membrane protein, partial [Cytophagales bacterium]
KKYTVSIGAMIGFSSINNSIDNSKLITESDLAFSQSNLQSLLPRAGFGIHVSQKKFYLGFSVPSFAIGNNNNVTDFFYNQQFFYGGYNWKVSDNFTLKPSIYARSLKGFGFLPDVNLMATFFSRFTGGVSYRHSYALIGLLNVKVNNQLHFGYSYDYLLPGNNAIASVSNGSHEIFIRYDFLYLVDNINMKKFK